MNHPTPTRPFWRTGRTLHRDRRGAFALEFAMVAPVFLLALLFIFSIGYSLFMQSVLDNATQVVARQIQIGPNDAANAAAFITNDLCPNTYGLLDCNEIYVRVEQINTLSCTDYYNATSGTLPVESGALELGRFAGESGNGAGADLGPTDCATPNSTTGFCNAGPNEAILITTIYVPPSFMDGLLGTANTLTYNGSAVSPLLATAGFETENFQSAISAAPC